MLEIIKKISLSDVDQEIVYMNNKPRFIKKKKNIGHSVLFSF